MTEYYTVNNMSINQVKTEKKMKRNRMACMQSAVVPA